MKIFSLSQGRQLALAGLLSGVLCVPHTLLSATLFLPNGSLVAVRSERIKHNTFLRLEDVEAKLPVRAYKDTETGLRVLCTTYDCRPVFPQDDEEMLVTDTAVYVNAHMVAEALGCAAKIKRKRDVYLTCAAEWPAQRVGAQVGERAPGFRLMTPLLSPREQRESNVTPLSSPRERGEGDMTPLLSPRERGENRDSLITLNDLLARGGVVIAFVRSGEWDPLSRLLLQGLESKLDSLREYRCEVVAVHGYELKTGAKWAAELRLHFPQLADHASAVMRGYDVFDRGNLPRCALFLLDERGVIRWREVFDNPQEVPSLEQLMEEVRGLR